MATSAEDRRLDPEDADSAETVDATMVSDLVERALDHFDAGGWRAVEDFLSNCSEQANAVRKRLDALARAGLIDVPSDASAPRTIGAFRILGVVGSGGMGIVYRAVQEPLGREVALKVIRPEQLPFGSARVRFRREVEIAATMRHPGIIPVFEVGETEGIPWFAMPLIEGVTLAEALTRLASSRPQELTGRDLLSAVRSPSLDKDATPAGDAPPLYAGNWNDCAARIGSHVADAVSHAHERGVLHRDLKPSNVMLTPSGDVLLLDFGVAAKSNDDASHVTRTGARVGTLLYMAPERLRVDNPEIDARADIYGIGALLHEMLALEAPFDGGVERLLQDIGAGRRRSLRQANKQVSWELETIIDVAMDPDPSRRYPDAAALRRDLEACLDKRPIEARRPSVPHRVVRAVQRRPVASMALLSLTLTFVVLPTVIAIRERSARERIGDALETANIERRRAESNLDRAVQALDLVTDAAMSELNVAGLEETRRQLLESVLEFHRTLLEQRGDDPRSLGDVAVARRNVAVLAGLLEKRETSRSAHEESVAAARAACAVVPRESRSTRILALALQAAASDAAARLDYTAAASMLEEAATLTADDQLDRAAHSQRESDGAIRAALARAYFNLKQPEPASRAADLATKAIESLCADCKHARHARELSAIRILRSQLALGAKDRGAAIEFLDGAVRAAETALEGDPHHASNQTQLVAALDARAVLASREKRFHGAILDHERAVEVLRRLIARTPDVRTHRTTLAAVLANLARSYAGVMRVADAERSTMEARDLLSNLSREDPDDLVTFSNLGAATMGLVSLRIDASDYVAARVELAAAKSALDHVLERRPNDRLARSHMLRQRLSEIRIDLLEKDHVAAARRLDALWKEYEIDSDQAWGAAMDYNRAADLAAADSSYDPDERAELAAASRDKALTMLEKLPSLGFRNVTALESNRALASLRDEPRFQALLDRMR